MTLRLTQALSAVLLVSAIAAGTYADRPASRRIRMVGDYRVLAADLHTHSTMWSNGGLTPWGLVGQAERDGLDALAITGHNQVLDAKVGRWFSRTFGGPTVLVGEEIQAEPRYHLVAVGIDERVGFNQPATNAIDDIHRQGGIAIAAHPGEKYKGWDAAAVERLDGSEMCHPLIYAFDDGQARLEAFAARGHMAAIGSSDFHGLGPMSTCRTFVFATANTPGAILDAIRAHRTVVYGREGKAYGDARLVAAAENMGLRAEAEAWKARGGALDWWSRAAGVVGLFGIVALRRQQHA